MLVRSRRFGTLRTVKKHASQARLQEADICRNCEPYCHTCNMSDTQEKPCEQKVEPQRKATPNIPDPSNDVRLLHAPILSADRIEAVQTISCGRGTFLSGLCEILDAGMSL